MTKPKSDRIDVAVKISARLALLFIDALLVMWFLHYAHETSSQVPAPGFWTVFWVLASVYVVAQTVKSEAV